MADKIQYFNNKRFTMDESTGYYLCSTKEENGHRKRMHVYVWEHYNGKIPKGYHVHHIDEDKSNNSIENLELLSSSEHLSLHGKERAANHYGEMIANLQNNACPQARKWHSSNEGREWHRMHYKTTKEKIHIKKKFICENCGKEFESSQVRSRFCSNNCKSAWRRKAGIDDVTKICQMCKAEYKANKYQKTKFCPLCRDKKY